MNLLVKLVHVSFITRQIEGKSQSIRRSFDNGTKAAQFIGPGSQPFDITIDIIGRLLFYTCPLSNTINVTRYRMNVPHLFSLFCQMFFEIIWRFVVIV